VLRLPTTRRAYLHSAISGFGAFFALYVIAHLVLTRFGLRAETSFLDDFLMGTLVAVLVIALEAQHELEVRAERQRAATIVELNHHIRNALQTIVYVNSGNPNSDEAGKVSQATQRIEWALREVSRQEHANAERDATSWTSQRKLPRASG
jgi:hypothetical protein